MKLWGLGPLLVWTVACSAALELDAPPAPRVVAVFDPDEGEIPTPNDALKDDETGRLDLPIEAEDSPAEQWFRGALNQLEGWSTASEIKLRFSGPVDPDSVGPATIEVWRWGEKPERLSFDDSTEGQGMRFEVDEADSRLVITPPRYGFEADAEYVVLVRGGLKGVKDPEGVGIGADLPYYFFKQKTRLDLPEHSNAFPGDTRVERMDNARKLERIRVQLAPVFAFFEQQPGDARIPREEVATLFRFRTTSRVELAMDRASQRIPVPFDVLRDPDTGLADLHLARWDTALEIDAKNQLNELDGFGVSMDPMFETTAPLDAASLTETSVLLFEVGEVLRQIPAKPRVMGDAKDTDCASKPVPTDCRHVFLEIDREALPLAQGTTYVVVLTKSVLGADGKPLVPMPMGTLLLSPHPLYENDESRVGVLARKDARRLEWVRSSFAPMLDRIGREGVVAAWPFTTLHADEGVERYVRLADELQLPAEPKVEWRKPPDEALREIFPGNGQLIDELGGWGAREFVFGGRLKGVKEVVKGTMKLPYMLDRLSRRFRDDGKHEMDEVRFYAAIPERIRPDGHVPVIIFGHGIVTDASWMMPIAGPFAEKGIAVISIDAPFHGERAFCVDGSLVQIPNVLPELLRLPVSLLNVVKTEGDLLSFYPCKSGGASTCSPTGQCLDANEQPEAFATFPVVSLTPVGGAAFLDVEDLPYIKDHFLQALADLGGLRYSLMNEDWEPVLGYPVATGAIHYVGLSLGSILGAAFTAFTPEIQRIGLNVPGADLVDLFKDSQFFGPQLDDYLRRQGWEPGDFEAQRLINVARWLFDSVDPATVAHRFVGDQRPKLMQLAEGDIIIPNHTTETLQRASQIPIYRYPSPLHMDLILPFDPPIAAGNPMMTDLVQLLDLGTLPESK